MEQAVNQSQKKKKTTPRTDCRLGSHLCVAQQCHLGGRHQEQEHENEVLMIYVVVLHSRKD